MSRGPARWSNGWRGWLLAGLIGLQACGARAGGPGCDGVTDVPWQRVAPGVWVWPPADHGDISVANAGHVVPTTALVEGDQALVIDPGPSHQHGLRLRRSLACRFGAQVRWIVNTHAHAENVLANSAFADGVQAGRVAILASAATREGMARRCPDCLASLEAKLGVSAMAQTEIVLPTATLREGDRLRLGRHTLRVMRVEQGHTDGDLVLWDASQRLLWAGGLVYGRRLPELSQGSLDGWLQALDRLAALRPRVVIGGTVSVASRAPALPPALTATRHYLRDLRKGVLSAMDRGLQATDASQVSLPAYRDWAGHEARQGFNAQRAWRELEPVWMKQGDSPAPPAASPPGGGAGGLAQPVPPRPETGPSAPETR